MLDLFLSQSWENTRKAEKQPQGKSRKSFVKHEELG